MQRTYLGEAAKDDAVRGNAGVDLGLDEVVEVLLTGQDAGLILIAAQAGAIAIEIDLSMISVRRRWVVGRNKLTMSYHAGIRYPYSQVSSSSDSRTRRSEEKSGITNAVARHGHRWRVRQHKLDLVKALAEAPVLDGRRPSMACVAQPVDEDDRGGVAGSRGEEQRLE